MKHNDKSSASTLSSRVVSWATPSERPAAIFFWKCLALGMACVLIGFISSAQAQQPVPGERGVAEVHAVVNFTELAQRESAAPPPRPERRVVPFMPIPLDLPIPPGVPIPRAPEGPTPAPAAPLAPSPAPAASFEALGDNDTSIPPDTQGAVGANHLMVTLNSQVRIQNKSGTALSTVTLNSFWSSTGATGVFDPKLSYDPFNNRWIFTAVSDDKTAASSVLIGVTQTSDPTGTWNLYRVDADAGNVNWADYPRLGFNKDWIVVSVSMFSNAGGSFQGSKIYAFEKADLYAGVSSATLTVFSDSNSAPAPAVTYDNSLATMYLADCCWTDNPVTVQGLRISTITGAVGSETYTAGPNFALTQNLWAFSPPGGNDFAPQKDTTQKIQNNDARILNVVYRNGSLWAAQNAFLPANAPTRTAAQWWQFTPSGTVQQFGRVDDSTGTIFYAFPSIAVNAQNDVLLGYSSFSATQFASANYSFRASSDAANTLRSDTLLKAGEKTYYKTFGGPDNRWGDYSNTVVDPANDLDFWTIQEYASSPVFPISGRDRWGTWWGKISPTTKKRRGQLISD